TSVPPDPGTTRSCAQCARPMRRFNYGGDSGIYLDLCSDHGIWFDADELRRVVVFVNSGGLAASRAHDEARPLQYDLHKDRAGEGAALLAWSLLEMFL